MRKLNTLVIGSGAAGLAAALRLHALGVESIAIYTEGLRMGTSINTGSDKQTYYKLGMYGLEPDSPALLARDLMNGGSVHGDLALVEAALSPLAFHHLVSLGVPFPHDPFGQYIGYKTDHDPKRRATSCGPYTSRDMCVALIREVKNRGVEIREKRIAVSLLTVEQNGEKRCCGAIFVNTKAGKEDALEVVLAENVVFAVGGPGAFYARSVYPVVHTGAIGLAIEAGAKGRNLAESQFGMASVRFRWNVSGSYMQVLPRFISRAADGVSDEKEFLREYFNTPEEMYNMIFLKGYQWPFAAGHVPGSSLIDIFVNIEIVERGRRVFLDYRSDPADYDFRNLNSETREYLSRSGAIADSPLKRLELLNFPALELYRSHGIDLAKEPLEIAVCAQHNNGGLAGNLWWESENIRHLFPVGEVNGSHGVTRPGGTALNAGQVGAFRAAEFIAARYAKETLDTETAEKAAEETLLRLKADWNRPAARNWKVERRRFQLRMSESGAFVREEQPLRKALAETREQLAALQKDGLAGERTEDGAEALRNRQILTAQILYLEAMLRQLSDGVGSRGGSIVLSPDGTKLHPHLSEKWRSAPENSTFRNQVLECSLRADTSAECEWVPCRELPETDGWFETVWSDYRSGKIYGEEKP